MPQNKILVPYMNNGLLSDFFIPVYLFRSSDMQGDVWECKVSN